MNLLVTIPAESRRMNVGKDVIGGVVLVGGLAVLPFLPHLIKGSVPPDINIYVLS